MHVLAKLPLRLENFALESGQTSTSWFMSRFASMWLACSACCSVAVKPGQHTDARKKGSTRSVFAAYDPSSTSPGVTVYQILQLWRELLLPIYSLSLNISTTLEWPCVQNGRWSASEGHLVWATTLCSPTCQSPQTPLQGSTKKKFKGTQHKYGKIWKTGNN